MSRSRRKVLVVVGLVLGVAFAVVGFAYVKGIRYLPLQFASNEAPAQVFANGIQVTAEGAIFRSKNDDGALTFRAFVAEPRLTLVARRAHAWRLRIHNVHRDASLSSSAPAHSWHEDRHGLTRALSGRLRAGETVQFFWRFPTPDRFRFAVIGDTGGNNELRWVLRRAAELRADFVLHLGDFTYAEGDFERALKAFDAASIPSFVAVGNHEFRRGWRATHQRFTRSIGPLNSTFALGGVQFVNLDTAVDSWPPYRGERGRFLQQLPVLADDPLINEYVVFTHRPLVDPDAARNHDINGPGEADWLRETLLGLGVKKLLVGHIHIKAEYDDAGLHTYISGEGLAYADLVEGRPVAELLIADVERGQPVRYRWEPLNMPLEAHCNARSWNALKKSKRMQLLDRLRVLCSEGD